MKEKFKFGGMKRKEKIKKYIMKNGEVVVWGGKQRILYKGIMKLKYGENERMGKFRINMKLRKELQWIEFEV